MTPLISVITINYNNSAGLERTVKSVSDQTYRAFEYIVIDGNSADGSRDVIEKYSDKISHWVSEPDSGIYNAMNKGIQRASGEYLLFLNSGDTFYTDDVLEKVNKNVSGHDLVLFDIELIFADRRKTHIYPSLLTFKTFYDGAIGHPTTFIRRALFERVGLYDESLKIVSDWKFFLEAVCRYNCSYIKIDAVLSTFYMDGVSMTNASKNIAERQAVLSELFPAFLPDYRKFAKIQRFFPSSIIKNRSAIFNKIFKNKNRKLKQ